MNIKSALSLISFPFSLFANYSARENKQQRVSLSLSLFVLIFVCVCVCARVPSLSLSISNATSCGLAVQAEPQPRAVFNAPLNWLCAIPIVNRYHYRVTSSSAN